jgi:hypothetical protein
VASLMSAFIVLFVPYRFAVVANKILPVPGGP